MNKGKSQKFLREDWEAGQNTKWNNPTVLLLVIDVDNINPQLRFYTDFLKNKWKIDSVHLITLKTSACDKHC